MLVIPVSRPKQGESNSKKKSLREVKRMSRRKSGGTAPTSEDDANNIRTEMMRMREKLKGMIKMPIVAFRENAVAVEMQDVVNDILEDLIRFDECEYEWMRLLNEMEMLEAYMRLDGEAEGEEIIVRLWRELLGRKATIDVGQCPRDIYTMMGKIRAHAKEYHGPRNNKVGCCDKKRKRGES